MEKWLSSALEYLPTWLELQIESTQQPGCLMAVVHRGEVVLEHGFGVANLATGEPLTPRHRFRIASHSKSFTASGIMKLREQGRLRLDDPVGRFVRGLGRQAASVTIMQLLSHSAGLTRDGVDAGQFDGRRPFLDVDDLFSDLAMGPVIDAGLRLKYSNHGYALLGLVIASITGEPYARWMEREVIGAAGLQETTPDMPLKRGTPFARGHTAQAPVGRRLVVPGDYNEQAITPAGGFVSTAADSALFFNQLSPTAQQSMLSPASRREMVRPHWRNPHATLEGHYGLGIMSGTVGGWAWFGHSGGLLGYISRTVTLPDRHLTLSIFSNAADGWAGFWADGAINILRTFAQNGPPSRRVGDWTGRWWSAWGAVDFAPMGNKVLVGAPVMGNHPFLDASEIEITGRDQGRIALAGGYGSHGETVRRVRDDSGKITEIWLAASRFVPRSQAVAELTRRYGRHGRPR
ncbi:MAG: beta-lactamase family protein [Alphaproteobacteria bacterium]|nr:beta-lactamase family protein [Alphaproteobacteria bacterium]